MAFEDLRDTEKALDAVLNDPGTGEFYYRASW
jgi:hypothetical protein